MKTKRQEVQAFIANCNAFNNDSFYPENNLNAASQSFLQKSKWKSAENWSDMDLPVVTEEELIGLGLDKKRAQLCILIMKYRELFRCISFNGDGRIWEYDSNSNWRQRDFFDRYYEIADWIFYSTSDEIKNIQSAVVDMHIMQKIHLEYKGEELRGAEGVKHAISELASSVNLSQSKLEQMVFLDKNPDRKALYDRLAQYIVRIESHKNQVNDAVDFSHGFWFFRSSRSINRVANYELAKKLLIEIVTPNSSFDKARINELRDEIITSKGLDQSADYVKRGIGSSELNKIIADAANLQTLQDGEVAANLKNFRS